LFSSENNLCRLWAGVSYGMRVRPGQALDDGEGEMRALVVAIFVLTSLPITPVAAQSGCTIKLGFKLIADQVPDVVGPCLEDEHFNATNGNAEQRTTAHHGKGGLLVWRKADNWTAFTDGYWTWVNGPQGLQRRLNTERFEWEQAEPAPAPQARMPERQALDPGRAPDAYVACMERRGSAMLSGDLSSLSACMTPGRVSASQVELDLLRSVTGRGSRVAMWPHWTQMLESSVVSATEMTFRVQIVWRMRLELPEFRVANERLFGPEVRRVRMVGDRESWLVADDQVVTPAPIPPRGPTICIPATGILVCQ
jgi:hypothetical protein